jgi:hypothetical protein
MTALTILLTIALAAGGLAGCKKKEPASAIPAPPEDEPVFWPYTGLEAENSDIIERRPLSVKIENSDVSRPQTNVSKADIVYETMVEGGETRLNCIYQSDIPDEVGNIRSARLSDVWIVPQYNALFFYSGSNREVNAGLKSVDISNMYIDRAPSLYYRSNDSFAPHNLYLKLGGAYKEAKKMKLDTKLDNIKPLVFGKVSESQESLYKPASGVTIPFANYSSVTWNWSEEDGKWLREQGGKIHEDKATGKQISCDTIVVMLAKYTVAAMKDPAGNPTYDCTLGGEGEAMILRDGKAIECTWKADADTPPTFTDANGDTVNLKPGETWFEVPPTDKPPVVLE